MNSRPLFLFLVINIILVFFVEPLYINTIRDCDVRDRLDERGRHDHHWEHRHLHVDEDLLHHTAHSNCCCIDAATPEV